MNPTGIESHIRLVLFQWVIIIVAAWAFGRLAKRLQQPLAVGEILAGIILGPSVLGLVWPSHWPPMFPPETQQSLQLLGKIGLILLLFQVGMEFDFDHLKTRSRTVLAVSVLGIAAPFAAGLAVGPWLHRTFAPDLPFFGFNLFFCIALSISALPIMGRMLMEWGLERTPLSAVAIGAAALDDVTGWVMLAAAGAVVTAAFDVGALVLQVGALLVFMLLLNTLIAPALRRAWRKSVAGQPEGSFPRGFFVLLLTTLFACCLITNLLGVFSIFGAFLLGMTLHREVALVRAWRTRFSDFVLVALVPVFFTNTGLNTEIGALNGILGWVGCGVVLLAAVAGKLGGCYLGARLTGQSAREAGCIAALMNTRALMALVAINVGLDLGLLNRQMFTMLVLMALLTTAMTAPLIRWWLPKDLRPGFRPG